MLGAGTIPIVVGITGMRNQAHGTNKQILGTNKLIVGISKLIVWEVAPITPGTVIITEIGHKIVYI